ncbi:MAG: hypothetical protein E7L15_17495 [Citrobacter portucalensis]|nr:hypothetical protein [Citrobacter portucalensis]
MAIRYNKIIGGPARKNDPQVQEAIMLAAAAPGSLMQLDANGKFVVHATEGGTGVPLVLQENYLGGMDVSENVPANATGVAVMCEDDVDYHVLVKAGEALLENEGLVSAGDGTLQKSTTPATDHVLFYAREKYTVASGGAELVKVRKSSKATA